VPPLEGMAARAVNRVSKPTYGKLLSLPDCQPSKDCSSWQACLLLCSNCLTQPKLRSSLLFEEGLRTTHNQG
jgi:hypothetical protein